MGKRVAKEKVEKTAAELKAEEEQKRKQKEEKEKKKQAKKERRKKRRKKMLIILVVLLIIGGIVYANRGNQTIAELVEDIPYLNEFFVYEGPYATLNKIQLRNVIEGLEEEIDALNTRITSLTNTESTLRTQISRLQTYESQYNAFVAEQDAWNIELAYQNPELFIEQFEQLNPEQAQNIYEILKGESLLTADQQAHAAVIAQMSTKQAASTIEVLVGTDPDLVNAIFNNMDTNSQSAILDELPVETVAQIIRLISPVYSSTPVVTE